MTLPKGQIEHQLHLTDSEDYEDRMRDNFGHTSCKAPYEWLEMSFPTCNFLHEADLTDLQGKTNRHKRESLLGSGYWRDAWKLQNDFNERVVAKNLRYEHEWQIETTIDIDVTLWQRNDSRGVPMSSTFIVTVAILAYMNLLQVEISKKCFGTVTLRGTLQSALWLPFRWHCGCA